MQKEIYFRLEFKAINSILDNVGKQSYVGQR